MPLFPTMIRIMGLRCQWGNTLSRSNSLAPTGRVSHDEIRISRPSRRIPSQASRSLIKKNIEECRIARSCCFPLNPSPINIIAHFLYLGNIMTFDQKSRKEYNLMRDRAGSWDILFGEQLINQRFALSTVFSTSSRPRFRLRLSFHRHIFHVSDVQKLLIKRNLGRDLRQLGVGTPTLLWTFICTSCFPHTTVLAQFELTFFVFWKHQDLQSKKSERVSY